MDTAILVTAVIFIVYLLVFAFNYNGKNTFKKKQSKPKYEAYRYPSTEKINQIIDHERYQKESKKKKQFHQTRTWFNGVPLAGIVNPRLPKLAGMTNKQWIASHALPEPGVIHLFSDANYNAYLLSPQWKIIASLIRRMYEGKCQTCGSTDNLNVHHTTYAFVYHELENIYTLMLICKDCHSKIDHEPILETWPGNQ